MKLLAADEQIRDLLELRFQIAEDLDRLRKLPLHIIEGGTELGHERTVGEEISILVESLDATDLELRRCMDALPSRVDGAAWYLEELERMAGAKREVAQRLQAEARRCEAIRDYFEQRIVDFMESRDSKEIRGNETVLKLAKNPPR